MTDNRPLIELTPLPEWSHFFGLAMVQNLLHFQWRQESDESWHCRAYDFSRDLSRPIETETLSEIRGSDKFQVLHDAIADCGRDVKQEVWNAFFAFRSAATGTAGQIEDLL